VKILPAPLRRKARKIKLLLLDVDGVLTDGGIVIDDRGVESKRFDVRDGQGITLLKRAGIEVGFVSGRSSGAVRQRAGDLGVKWVFQGIQNKAEVYQRIKKRTGLKDDRSVRRRRYRRYANPARGRPGHYGAERLAGFARGIM
jgi:3-deoxy-D-manno-octulosonate 8-phosphate phosphatase (KDO 8-P phosphatase)